jgi:hypothetical protein
VTEQLKSVLEIIGAIAGIATLIAPFLPRESIAGKWLAWIASCPIGHQPIATAPKSEPTTPA